ncbi:alpha/beta fold hydrolase [Niveispirillum irakense]|uniref:alpha/beta fold hydrolase n=1 Tax=Niveispirillum irakense TaxID=34011 RepID=UPI00041820BA|nr:alpha/beta fold hydrolase [Niveispirillum irakense]
MADPNLTAPLRLGPRPLGLHLGMGLGILMSSPAGLPLLSGNWPHWHPSLRPLVDGLRADLAALSQGADAGPDQQKPDPAGALSGAVDREMRRRIDRFFTGLERYRNHPYQRDIEDAPTLWREGTARLLDFGGQGRPVLFVPSLVNRGYILDLSFRKSLLRWLAGQGLRPFLLEWGQPGPAERGFTLTDIVAGRLARALDALCAHVGGPVSMVGYCMGGLLALAAALRQPDQVSAFVAMATPWDFHADDAAAAKRTSLLLHPFEPSLHLLGELPVDGVQMLFATLDPLLALKKFSHFAQMDPATDAADDFVALEDWLNDGVTLPAAIARECLAGWYGENTPGKGEWCIDGQPVDPAGWTKPSLVIVPARDRIVPPASANALATRLPNATQWHPPLGHIGMVVSGSAQEKVWQPLRDWLLGT